MQNLINIEINTISAGALDTNREITCWCHDAVHGFRVFMPADKDVVNQANYYKICDAFKNSKDATKWNTLFHINKRIVHEEIEYNCNLRYEYDYRAFDSTKHWLGFFL